MHTTRRGRTPEKTQRKSSWDFRKTQAKTPTWGRSQSYDRLEEELNNLFGPPKGQLSPRKQFLLEQELAKRANSQSAGKKRLSASAIHLEQRLKAHSRGKHLGELRESPDPPLMCSSPEESSAEESRNSSPVRKHTSGSQLSQSGSELSKRQLKRRKNGTSEGRPPSEAGGVETPQKEAQSQAEIAAEKEEEKSQKEPGKEEGEKPAPKQEGEAHLATATATWHRRIYQMSAAAFGLTGAKLSVLAVINRWGGKQVALPTISASLIPRLLLPKQVASTIKWQDFTMGTVTIPGRAIMKTHCANWLLSKHTPDCLKNVIGAVMQTKIKFMGWTWRPMPETHRYISAMLEMRNLLRWGIVFGVVAAGLMLSYPKVKSQITPPREEVAILTATLRKTALLTTREPAVMAGLKNRASTEINTRWPDMDPREQLQIMNAALVQVATPTEEEMQIVNAVANSHNQISVIRWFNRGMSWLSFR